MGKAVVAVDILLGPEFDLTSPIVYSELKGWISAGLVWGVLAGTPCETFSRARRAPPHSAFPGPLRSNEFPRGLKELDGKELRKVSLSNLISDRAATLIELARSRGLVGGEENPATSILWQTRARQAMITRPSVVDYVVDHCAHGTPYRARTRFRLFNCGDVPRLTASRCSGRGICSYSRMHHVSLTGTASGGGWATKVKAAYPVGLCNILAKAFVQSADNTFQARIWAIFNGGSKASGG
jgi:hypothetical protein